MIIRNISFQNDFPIEEDHNHTIQIASPRLFSRIVQSFVDMENGDEPLEKFIIIEDDTAINAAKYLLVVTDPFHIDINSKKNLTMLYNRIENRLKTDEELFSQWSNYITKANDVLETVVSELSVDVRFCENYSIQSYAKTAGVEYELHSEGEIPSGLYSLIDIIAEFGSEKLLIFCNIHPYLNQKTWKEIMKYACYTKVKLIDIEHDLREDIGQQEIRWIIDGEFDDRIERG